MKCTHIERKENRLPVFTRRFRELQGERSNTEFADFLGLSRQTVGFYCNGDRLPDVITLIQIAERCNISADYLLGMTDEKTPDMNIRSICECTGLSMKAVVFLGRLTAEDDSILNVLRRIIDAILYSESLDNNVRYSVGLMLRVLGYCKVIPGPNNEPCFLPRNVDEQSQKVVNDAEELGFLVYPPDVALRYYLNMVKNDVSENIERVLKEYLASILRDDHPE